MAGILEKLFAGLLRRRHHDGPTPKGDAPKESLADGTTAGNSEAEPSFAKEEPFAEEPTSQNVPSPKMSEEEKEKKWHSKEQEILEKEGLKELNKSFVELADKFASTLKEKFEIELGYKMEDMETLEGFIREHEAFFEKELKAEKKKLLPLLYAYIGEVIRRNNKGSWKKPSAKQSAIEVVGSDGETELVYPGTLIKQRIENKTPLMELVGIKAHAA